MAENKIVDISKRLQESRKKAGLTQANLAAKFEITAAAISQWEVGSAAPSIELVPKLCLELGISPDWLFSVNEAKNETLNRNQLQKKELSLLSSLESAFSQKKLSEKQIELLCGVVEQFIPPEAKHG